MEKKGGKRIIVVIAVIIILFAIILSYLTFFYYQKVTTQEKFNQNLYLCKRTDYISDEASATWRYKIEGKRGENCLVNVELITAKKGSAELKTLEGKDMDCYIPQKLIVNPISNLKTCHGLLKEEMQNIMLSNMHAYVTSNLDIISQALNSS